MAYAPNLNFLWARLLIDELARSGVKTFCVSPGSRSAPLAVAVSQCQAANAVIHFDERAAAFHALGHAKATGRPAAFICSSGTAVANAMPAVIEASMACVPLIVITADRPPELIDTGANQTIRQPGLFGDYLRWRHDLPCPNIEIPPETVLTVADQAVYRAHRSPAGPVHLNCMYREPLTPEPRPYGAKRYTAAIESWFESSEPYTTYVRPNNSFDPRSIRKALSPLENASKGLLIVGSLASVEESEAAKKIARLLGWPVLPDIASGLRLGQELTQAMRGASHTKGVAPFLASVTFFDQMLIAEHGALHETDCLVHIGGAMTSQRLLNLIATNTNFPYVRVADTPARKDPSHRATVRIESTAAEFHGALAKAFDDGLSVTTDTSWCGALRQESKAVSEELVRIVDEADSLDEIAVARLVARHAPPDSFLFLGNSMPIRDADMFAPEDAPALTVAANRGASGIDGNIATGIGCGAALGLPATIVLGDLAALHDLNALKLCETCAQPIVLIVLNNDGGGIFSMLPIARHEVDFDRFFGTPHGMTFRQLAEAFGLQYHNPATQAAFVEAYENGIARGSRTLIEVSSSREANAARHKEIEVAIRKVLG